MLNHRYLLGYLANRFNTELCNLGVTKQHWWNWVSLFKSNMLICEFQLFNSIILFSRYKAYLCWHQITTTLDVKCLSLFLSSSSYRWLRWFPPCNAGWVTSRSLKVVPEVWQKISRSWRLLLALRGAWTTAAIATIMMERQAMECHVSHNQDRVATVNRGAAL